MDRFYQLRNMPLTSIETATGSSAPDKLFTVAEVAERFGVNANWVHCHASGNRMPVLPSLKVGKYRRFRSADIERFLRLCESLAQDQAARKARQLRRVA
jgi:hypothetical protein